MQLNDQQLKIVNTPKGKIAVVAGAGSGKTSTNLELITKLYLNDGVSLDRLFVTTFTNKAARDIKERLQKKLKLNEDVFKKLWLGTFHSLGYRYLTQIKNLKLNIILPVEANHYLKNIYNQITRSDEDTESSFSEIVQSIEKKRNKNCDWKDVSEYPEICSEMLSLYQKEKKEQNLVDYTDILDIFEEHLKTDTYFRNKFDWVFVDECQDNNAAQHRIADLLGAKSTVLTGDNKQSIYSFRGASPQMFKDKIKTCNHVYPLSYNYRSTKEIIDFANTLLVQIPSFLGQELISTKNSGPKPIFTVCENMPLQILYAIKDDIKRGIPLHEIAVLGRSVKPANIQNLQVLLRQNNIPYSIKGGDDKLNASYIQNYLSTLKSILTPTKVSLINTLAMLPSVGAKTAMTLADGVVKNGFSHLREVSAKYTGTKSYNAYLNLELVKDNKKELLLKALDFIYDCYLVPVYGKKDMNEPGKKKTLIFDVLFNYLMSFPRIVDGIDSLYVNEEDVESEKGKIVISTVHASKGLEWDSVHIANMNEFSMPFLKEDELGNEEREEEEFCITYVAATRAKKQLRMYMAFTSGSGSWSKTNKISRYIKETYIATGEKFFNLRILDVADESAFKQKILLSNAQPITKSIPQQISSIKGVLNARQLYKRT